MKTLKWIGAAILAVFGAFFAWQANRHLKKSHKLSKRAFELEEKKGRHVDTAKVARAKASTEHAKSNEALVKAKSLMNKVEKTDESLSDRVSRVNRRLRND